MEADHKHSESSASEDRPATEGRNREKHVSRSNRSTTLSCLASVLFEGQRAEDKAQAGPN